MFKSIVALSVTFLGLAGFVVGHGYVQEITLGNTTHTGYLPFSDPYASPPYVILASLTLPKVRQPSSAAHCAQDCRKWFVLTMV